jgi:predicted regulator of Ras-like GTPase activity (Roadblock/LC7/MglB family)
LKKEFACIREVALIDKGGFVLANNFENKQRAQITGALIAGIYHTLQNYLAQISMGIPTGIFFETADSNSFILKTGEQVLFSAWDKDFSHIEYGPLVEIIEKEDFSNLDLRPYADLMDIKAFTIADTDGTLVNAMGDRGAAQGFAAVTTAIFENLKVFLMNIQLLKLSKIVVFTPETVVTIIKTGDKIISMLTEAENYPKISEELLKMEEIY